MGTRHLTAVMIDGEYKVAQYGQWDGDPGSAGNEVLHALNVFRRDKMAARMRSLEGFYTSEELEEIQKDIDKMKSVFGDKSEILSLRYGHLFRDMGSGIINFLMSYDGYNVKKTNGYINFAADSLSCEWAYVVDFDKGTFEIYEGFNQTPLSKDERFYGYTDEDTNPEYHPVRFLKSYDLDDLPEDLSELIEELENREEEEYA